jgi:hypothetical protein
MVHLYTSKTSIPSNLKYVYDAEGQFLLCSLRMTNIFNNEVSNKFIEDIEGITSRIGDAVTNKFGTYSIKNVSTGCKAGLLAINYPDYAVSNIEMGDNVLEALFDAAKDIDINIVLDNHMPVAVDDDVEATFDGKLITDVYGYLEEYYSNCDEG